jgi:hypothetical protein
MSDTETHTVTLTSLQAFLVKVGAVLAACIVFFIFAVVYVESEIENAGFALKGGPEFWHAVEKKLYEVADAKDVPEEKKARILAALHRIGQKYGPYIDALHGR